MKILLIEDDGEICEFLKAALAGCGYTVDAIGDGQVGLDMIAQWEYDLIVLDVMLPQLNGITVCQQLRAKESKVPILLLTAKDTNEDVITGLDAGADDYLTKPFDLTQLLARVRALLRRRNTQFNGSTLTWENLCLNWDSKRVAYGNREIILKTKEYQLLELFLHNPQRVFNRSEIIDRIWTIDDCPTEAAVTNLVKDLRQRLRKAGCQAEVIETIYGLGYRLLAPPTPPIAEQSEPPPETPVLPTGEAAIAQAAAWFYSSLPKRIAVFIELEQAIQNQTVALEQVETAREEAHKLVGGMGTFGLMRGSEIAQKLDRLLSESELIEPKQLQLFSQLLAQLKQEVIPTPSSTPISPTDLISILTIADDPLFVENLQKTAFRQGITIQTCLELETVQQQIENEHPRAIMILLGNKARKNNHLSLIKTLKAKSPDLPLLVVGEQDNLSDRIAVARVGGNCYLLKSTPMEEMAEAIAHVLSPTQIAHGKVMVVDDDPIFLQYLQELLIPSGLQVISLQDPSQFWQVLNQTDPHLLLLDWEMPRYQGLELCQLVRQDNRYRSLPVWVVTAHQDIDRMAQVFQAGAEDFVLKPFHELKLVARIVNRVRRSLTYRRQIQAQQDRIHSLEKAFALDPLTLLPNSRYFSQLISKEWEKFPLQPLAIILCDIDRFQNYNHHYGHLAGDLCLQEIAKTIQKAISGNDALLARYGNDEFAIGLPNADFNRVLGLVEQIQCFIQNLNHHTSDSESNPLNSVITLSFGVTGSVPTQGRSVHELMATAQQALDAAKARGGNAYCLLSR